MAGFKLTICCSLLLLFLVSAYAKIQIIVVSQASFAQKEVQEGETVVIGTSFRFGVDLSTVDDEEINLTSGDYTVHFDVLDSSSLSIRSESLKITENKAPISFSYTLNNYDIPSGSITFRFSVKNAEGVQATKDVVYKLSLTMIAAHITFEKYTYKIGETVKISAIPATSPDLVNVYAFNATDANGISASRNFVLEVHSPGGVLLKTITGTPSQTSDKKTKYEFAFPVTSTLDSIGRHIVSFVYVPTSGPKITLSNYDSTLGELYDESSQLNFTVKAHLQLHGFVAPQVKDNAQFTYGDNINFKFQIKDTESGKFVLAGQPELANVYLSLKHEQEGKTKSSFTSSNQSAVHFLNKNNEPEGFSIEWSINPNAVGGAATLVLAAQDADGNSLGLFQEKSNAESKWKVTIGGSITVSSKHYISSPVESTDTVFLVEFELFCNGKPLKDAQLLSVVTVSTANGQIELVKSPVGTNNGVYSVSWSLPSLQVPAGKYSLQIFREVDRKKDEKAKSLFDDITFNYEGTGVQLPFRTEFFVAVILGAAFFFVSNKKTKYT